MESVVKISCGGILYKMLNKCRITGSVLDKNKIKKIVFFLFNEQLAISRNLNGRNNMLMLTNVPLQGLKLHLRHRRLLWVFAKSQGPCFRKKQIRIVTLNYSDTAIDGDNTKRENI
jgi:hypothetical protein